jgi:hypothetical protein
MVLATLLSLPPVQLPLLLEVAMMVVPLSLERRPFYGPLYHCDQQHGRRSQLQNVKSGQTRHPGACHPSALSAWLVCGPYEQP